MDVKSVSVIAEDADDLLILRRVIRPGDRLVGDTTRTIKRDRDYSRPDRGERVRIRIALDVERISLDGVLDRLRAAGTISESSNEAIPHGSHHSLTLRAGDGIAIAKKRWGPAERRLLRSGGKHDGFVLVAIDTESCGVARLHGTHLDFMPNIYSGSGGKRYKTSFDAAKYLEQARAAAAAALKDGDSVVIFGPGETKKRLANFVQASKALGGAKISVIEGIDSGGEDGIYTFTKSDAAREAISGSKLAKVSAVLDEVMGLAHKKSKRFTMGFAETRAANGAGAVGTVVFSERALQDNDEQEVVDFLNDAEAKGAKVYGVDSTTDIGLRVAGLGGMVSLLRYQVAT